MEQLRLPVGIEDFAEIRRHGYYYVDKTQLIEQVLNRRNKVSLFTRPRRFGKTLNMSMLQHFFEIGTDPKFFQGLSISKNNELCEKHMGKYPVVSISLKSIHADSYAKAKAQLIKLVNREARRVQFLLDSDRLTAVDKALFSELLDREMEEDTLVSSLQELTELLEIHFGQQVIVLIDEYDVPLAKANQNGYYDEMALLLRNFFENVLRNDLNILQIFTLNFGLSALLMARDIAAGTVSASAFTSVMFACSTMSGSVGWVSNELSEMKKHALYIEKLQDFLNKTQEAKGTVSVAPGMHEITLQDVHFHYSANVAREVTDGISLHIKSGEKIALVGENGAGKTTLIKLIEGLYRQTAGSILIDKMPIETFDGKSLRGSIATVMQKPVHYSFTIAENILLREVQNDTDRRRVQKVLEESGLWERVSHLPKGMDSVLGKEFDEEGIELSGGESQKLAIARALYEDAGVLILDEPANSLDPIAEAEMYERMFAAGKDRTLILISHRLYSTRKADRICYIENGKIAEEGTHEELMKANGKYAAMYHLQAGLYAQE